MVKKHYGFEEQNRTDDWGEYKKDSKKKRRSHREDVSSNKRSLKEYNLEDDYYEQEETVSRRGAGRW
jgi:hypothetical protein